MSQVFKLGNVVEGDALLHYPVLEIGINSKISSLCWNSYVKSCLLAADYEGGLQLWDVSSNSVTSQFEEHSKRIWSVDFSAVSFNRRPTQTHGGGEILRACLTKSGAFASPASDVGVGGKEAFAFLSP
jgi:WD40 repeat protein